MSSQTTCGQQKINAKILHEPHRLQSGSKYMDEAEVAAELAEMSSEAVRGRMQGPVEEMLTKRLLSV